MKYFYEKALKPFILKEKYRDICEIGAAGGENTDLLAGLENVTVTVVDPCHDADLTSKYAKNKKISVYKRKSLDALRELNQAFDCFLIDGDHNWYTVFNELKAIEEKSLLKAGGTIFLHDVRWPYARRDMYYLPEDIPESYRHPYARKGMERGRKDLSDSGGMNANHYNALYEGGERNGVLTAVEDFLKIHGRKYYFFCYNRGEGLGVLIKKKSERTFFVFLVWFLKLKLRYYERKESVRKRLPPRFYPL